MENEPKKETTKKPTRAESLEQRANDADSLNHFFGPTSAKAIRGALLVLADMEKDKPELLHVRELPQKRARV